MGKKEPASVTMRVRVGDNELEVTGPSDYVESKIAEFLKQQGSTLAGTTKSIPTQHTTQPSSTTSKGISIAQFFKKVGPKSDVDRILAAGYFLEKFRNEEKFTAAEVTQAVRSSKTPPPQNPSDCVGKNIRKGYMMAAGDKEGKMAFVLTTDGEEAIESSLNS